MWAQQVLSEVTLEERGEELFCHLRKQILSGQIGTHRPAPLPSGTWVLRLLPVPAPGTFRVIPRSSPPLSRPPGGSGLAPSPGPALPLPLPGWLWVGPGCRTQNPACGAAAGSASLGSPSPAPPCSALTAAKFPEAAL